MGFSSYIYEVNIVGPNSLKADFARWLDGHIQDMLGLPMFEGAEIEQLDGHGDQFVLRVLYSLNSKDDLMMYFNDHAATMRNDLPEKFSSHLKYSRFQYPMKSPAATKALSY